MKKKLLFEGYVNSIIIGLSIVPLMTFREFRIIDELFLVYFLFEFIYHFKQKSGLLVLILDVISLLSFIPSLNLFRLAKLTRIMKIISNSKEIKLLFKVFNDNRYLFLGVVKLSIIYMLCTSIIVFNLEPQTFSYSYFKAFYWSGITLTTVGYGDIYPVTTAGQIVSLISSFMGIGIIALPTGLIGSSLVNEFAKNK